MTNNQKRFQLPINYTTLLPSDRRLVRQQYIAEQNGICPHCHETLDGPASKQIMSKKINIRLFPVTFFKYPIHLHHDHKTGMTIGAVHNYCNAVLWQYHGE